MTQRVVRRGSMLAAIVCVLTLVARPGPAKDLGVRGTVWPIAEPDLLTEIEARLGEMETSGDLARMRREALDLARERVEAPERVEGIVPARVHRIRLFDPSITVERDIRTHDGVLIAARGTRINPLDVHPLTRDLLFIDGARPVEVAWALRHEPAREDRAPGGPSAGPHADPRPSVLLRPGRPALETFRARRHAVGSHGRRVGASDHGSAAGGRSERHGGRSPAMKFWTTMGVTLVLAGVLSSGTASAQSCTGRFVNPVTDVCWECLFPISIGPIRMGSAAGAPDTPNPGSPICLCGKPIPTYWALARDVGAGAAPRREPCALVLSKPRRHDRRPGPPRGARTHRFVGR